MKGKYQDYNFSFIRAFFCIAIFLYHLNILKGGYLAVCSLFVVAGYFSALSLTKKDEILEYFKKRFRRIYWSLIVVVLITLSIIIFMNIDILSLKNEVKSILLSYNNYWQLDANSDYFAKHISSPYIHLWYMSMLIQIQIVFSLIYVILKKLGEKVHRVIPCGILFLLSIIGLVYFYNVSVTKDIMFTYYSTLSRCFSFLFGAFLASIHLYYKKHFLIPNVKKGSYYIYILYLAILNVLFITVKASSSFFAVAMIITTIITTRLIDYGILLYNNNIKIENKLISFIALISYEIYLVQYPVIYFFGFLKINEYLKIILIVIVTIIISWLIHIAMEGFKKDKIRYLRLLVQILTTVLSIYGLYQFIILKDHTKEMEELKNSLVEKEEIIKQKQLEYKQKQIEEEQKWEEYIKSFDVDEEKLYEYVTNMKIVGIGDSIMLDPINSLYKAFPNGYFDAKISRSTCAAVDVLKSIKKSGIKWDVLVFNLGTNGYPSDKCKNGLMDIAGDSKVFWLNATGADYSNNNAELERYAKGHSNIYILDWVSEVSNHSNYLYADKVHLKPNAFNPYAKFIKDEIYKVLLKERNEEKEKNIKNAIENKKEKITFYGNDLLTNVFDELQNKYNDSKFEVSNNKEELIKYLEEEIKDNSLNDILFFVFDNQIKLEKKDYEKIIELCKDKTIYIVSMDNLEFNYDNVNIINLNIVKDDYTYDKIHLNDKANERLISLIENEINK